MNNNTEEPIIHPAPPGPRLQQLHTILPLGQFTKNIPVQISDSAVASVPLVFPGECTIPFLVVRYDDAPDTMLAAPITAPDAASIRETLDFLRAELDKKLGRDSKIITLK